MQRTKILPNRVSGTVVEVKPKFGWIQPDAPIQHPEAIKRKGRVYLSTSDVEGGLPAIGEHVTFFVYTDGTGLGAMNCKKEGGPGAQKPIGKPEVLKPGGAAAGAKAGRESLGEDHLYTGKIQVWNGSHGWIMPIDSITHPKFNGKIYLKSSDVDTPGTINMGMMVSFFLYVDVQGLGAEHCTVIDAEMAEEADPTMLKSKPKGGFPQSPFPPASPPQSPDVGEHTMLKAKPKMAAAPDSASSVLKAKPKMSAASGTTKPGTVTLPAHLSAEMGQRLVAWMWDRGG